MRGHHDLKIPAGLLRGLRIGPATLHPPQKILKLGLIAKAVFTGNVVAAALIFGRAQEAL